ncbi:unnamed protein product [Sphagnum tenellum]
MKKEVGEATMKQHLSQLMAREKRKCRRASHWAVRMGRHEVVRLLIESNYTVDLNKAFNVRRLLDNADVKSYGWYQTPLALAVLSGHFEVVNVLCEARKGGIRTDAKTEKRKSAIQIAFEKSRYRANDRFNPIPVVEIWK